jgi:hypothetical protein
MGLEITVGFLVALAVDDPESVPEFRPEFRALSDALVEAGHPPHEEPETADWEPLSFGMHSYSGLHYLRRIAAHLAAGRDVPPPGDESVAEDDVLQSYYRAAGAGGLSGLLRRKGAVDRRFDHLILHGDAEGVYVPAPFEEVLHSNDVMGEAIGSAPKLARECEELMDALGVPDDLDPDGDEVWDASANQGEGDGWRRYGVEAFTSIRLLAAARASIERSAAVVFH